MHSGFRVHVAMQGGSEAVRQIEVHSKTAGNSSRQSGRKRTRGKEARQRSKQRQGAEQMQLEFQKSSSIQIKCAVEF